MIVITHSSLTRSRGGPQRHPRVSTHDGSTPEVSRRCTVFSVEVGQTTCTEGGLDIASSSGLEWQIYDRYVAPQGLVARCVLWKSGYNVQTVSCDDGQLNSAVQHRTETCQTGNVCVPHMVLPTDLVYLALAFHMEGLQLFYVGSE